MRITWIGHSTVLLEADGVRLLTDPALRGRMTHLRRVMPTRGDALRLVDTVLVSHLHYDHLDIPSLRRLGPATALVVPSGAGPYLRGKGFQQLTELDAGESVQVGPFSVRATHASHPGTRPPYRIEAPALGYLLETGSTRVYFAGDTDVFPEMADLAPGLDVALLPIWGWGATLGPGHLDPRGAAEALTLLRPRIVVPIHWGTYFPLRPRRRGSMPSFLSEPVESFRRHAAKLAPGVDVRVLGLGDSLDVD